MVMAQQVTAPLDKNDPEIRAVLAEIELDIEKARQEKKIAGLSMAVVYDQDVLLSKGFGFADLDSIYGEKDFDSSGQLVSQVDHRFANAFARPRHLRRLN